MDTATKAPRNRAGAILLELDAADRKRLERLRDKLTAQTGVKVGLAGAIRSLIRRAEKNPS